MRYLHVISSVDPRGGGPIDGIKSLAHVTNAQGNQVEILSLDDPQAAWVKDAPLPVHAVGPSIGGYCYSPRLHQWLSKNARSYDALVVNGLWQYHGLAVWRALRHSSIPYVVFPHGMLDPWFKQQYPLKHLKKYLYWHLAEYHILRDASLVCFTAEEERLLAAQSFHPYRVRERVVRYGTGDPQEDAAQCRQDFLQKFPQLAGKRYLLYLSRIHPKKGLDLLLPAFAAALATDPDLVLVIAGPDSVGWQSTLEALARRLGVSDRILWTGMLTGNLKWGAYHCAEAFVLPSHQENFGIVVAEALARSCPVLITQRVNIWREIVAEQGGLVEEDTLEGIQRLLERWLQLPEQERARMRPRAALCFQKHFRIADAAATLIEVLNEVKAGSEVKAGNPDAA